MRHRFIIFILLILAFRGWTQEKRFFLLQEQSSFRIIGHTNISQFHCHFDRRKITMDAIGVIINEKGFGTYQFKGADIPLSVYGFDCGNRLMNRDLYALLHAERYPEIQIQILSLSIQDDKSIEGKSLPLIVSSQVVIQINGEEKTYELSGLASAKGQSFQFEGKVCMNLIDFHLAPPQKLMGLIKVQDQIEIKVNLMVEEI